MLPTSATVEEAWSTLASALGVADVSAGQRWSAPDSGAPWLAGVVDEAVHVAPHRAILVLRARQSGSSRTRPMMRLNAVSVVPVPVNAPGR